ncbi:MAG TPA: START domain-containing protein [Chryseolinea sp.]|nr:START domain-containing protein [Chryseolinea sp.]
MNSYRKIIIATIALLLSTAGRVEGQHDCELKKQNKDLKVYSCTSGDNALKVVKVELTLENTSIKELLDFVTDIPNYVNWQYNTKEATILTKTDRSIIYRAVVETPWPLANRELIVEITTELDSVGRVLIIDSHHVAYAYPQAKHLIRVPYVVGIWHVSSVKNSLKVEFILRIDPGGSVPVWLVNVAMAEGPYHSFMKLKEELKQKRP